MAKFLFVFCYQTPEQLSTSSPDGFSDETSRALFIEAESSEVALGWGSEIAEEFVRRLFDGRKMSWKTMGYANWIEPDPEAEYPKELLAALPTVARGRHPDFNKLRL